MIMNFDLQFEDSENTIDLSYDDVTIVPVPIENDHSLLLNRDIDSQHPINAITGLRTELDENKASSEYLDEIKLEESDLKDFSNKEVQDLWNKYIK